MFTKDKLIQFLNTPYENINKLEEEILKEVSKDYKEVFIRGVFASRDYTTTPFNESLSERERANTNVMYPLMAYDPWLYRNASEEIRSDVEIAEIILSRCGMLLKDAPKKFRDNKHLVMVAISNSPYALEFASPRLKDDDDVVECAVSRIGRSLIYASDRFKTDKAWIQKAFDRDQAAFIVDDEAARIFHVLDGRMVKDCARRKASDYAGQYYVPDENKIYKHKVYRKYRDFYDGKIITAGQMLRMQQDLLDDQANNYIAYKLD